MDVLYPFRNELFRCLTCWTRILKWNCGRSYLRVCKYPLCLLLTSSVLLLVSERSSQDRNWQFWFCPELAQIQLSRSASEKLENSKWSAFLGVAREGHIQRQKGSQSQSPSSFNLFQLSLQLLDGQFVEQYEWTVATPLKIRRSWRRTRNCRWLPAIFDGRCNFLNIMFKGSQLLLRSRGLVTALSFWRNGMKRRWFVFVSCRSFCLYSLKLTEFWRVGRSYPVSIHQVDTWFYSHAFVEPHPTWQGCSTDGALVLY